MWFDHAHFTFECTLDIDLLITPEQANPTLQYYIPVYSTIFQCTFSLSQCNKEEERNMKEQHLCISCNTYLSPEE